MRWSIYRRFPIAIFLAMTLCGCQSASYYSQAVVGQARIMLAQRPIAELLEEPGTSQALREKLSYVLALREFARTELLLPVGGAYLDYVDLHRSRVVWNVFAAPELSLEPKTWCYPLVGCASYRGYFAPQEAENYSADLSREGYDVFVAGALAYSTLGWFDDPVLSTFLQLDDTRLSALIFHELTHRMLYVAGDTSFNESLATTVEEEGLRRWAAASQTPGLLAEYDRRQRLNDRFIALVSHRRNELSELYAGDFPVARKRAGKTAIFGALRRDFEAEKLKVPEMAMYDHWFASGLNNAGLASIAVYHDLVPAFKSILSSSHGDLAAFYQECGRLSRLPIEKRQQHLRQMMSMPPSGE
ncbi:MAG: aminopeptidase [Hyphomicrobiales bacterium]